MYKCVYITEAVYSYIQYYYLLVIMVIAKKKYVHAFMDIRTGISDRLHLKV